MAFAEWTRIIVGFLLSLSWQTLQFFAPVQNGSEVSSSNEISTAVSTNA